MAMKREECKQWVMQQLQAHGGEMTSKSLELAAQEEGYSFITLRRAKTELRQLGCIRVIQTGNAREKTWYIQKILDLDFFELPDDTETPWNGI
jgi:hypothetical protein